MERSISELKLKKTYGALQLIRKDLVEMQHKGGTQWELAAMLKAEAMAREEFRLLKIALEMEMEEQAANEDTERDPMNITQPIETEPEVA